MGTPIIFAACPRHLTYEAHLPGPAPRKGSIRLSEIAYYKYSLACSPVRCSVLLGDKGRGSTIYRMCLRGGHRLTIPSIRLGKKKRDCAKRFEHVSSDIAEK